MEISWISHGYLMEISWKSHSNLMEITWKSHGNLIGILEKSHDDIKSWQSGSGGRKAVNAIGFVEAEDALKAAKVVKLVGEGGGRRRQPYRHQYDSAWGPTPNS